VKDEWIQQTRAEAFRGYEAWGYLDTKMSMLMTRLLNLDLNVIVLAHYKTAKIKGADDSESREIVLQLQGDIQNTIYNDDTRPRRSCLPVSPERAASRTGAAAQVPAAHDTGRWPRL
jgi:AAA domain